MILPSAGVEGPPIGVRQFLLLTEQARALRGRGGLPVTTYMSALIPDWNSP